MTGQTTSAEAAMLEQGKDANLAAATAELAREAMPISTAGELRGFLADVLTGIRDGTVAVDKAQAIAKVAAQINQSLTVEVNAALQIRRMGDGHPEAGSMMLTSDLPVAAGGGTWCDQCDRRVTKEKLAGCTSEFCVKVKGS